jgi:hypothetical protein
VWLCLQAAAWGVRLTFGPSAARSPSPTCSPWASPASTPPRPTIQVGPRRMTRRGEGINWHIGDRACLSCRLILVIRLVGGLCRGLAASSGPAGHHEGWRREEVVPAAGCVGDTVLYAFVSSTDVPLLYQMRASTASPPGLPLWKPWPRQCRGSARGKPRQPFHDVKKSIPCRCRALGAHTKVEWGWMSVLRQSRRGLLPPPVRGGKGLFGALRGGRQRLDA